MPPTTNRNMRLLAAWIFLTSSTVFYLQFSLSNTIVTPVFLFFLVICFARWRVSVSPSMQI
ncbi:uncharacterized protein V1513DRAFT_445530 [Lipomyces chichibuensis]|uniref:uncharacterized protein n=1 Tax=Lipomyces chichibuensis TaxID=1546026 RepID=UPI003342ECFB